MVSYSIYNNDIDTLDPVAFAQWVKNASLGFKLRAQLHAYRLLFDNVDTMNYSLYDKIRRRRLLRMPLQTLAMNAHPKHRAMLKRKHDASMELALMEPNKLLPYEEWTDDDICKLVLISLAACQERDRAQAAKMHKDYCSWFESRTGYNTASKLDELLADKQLEGQLVARPVVVAPSSDQIMAQGVAFEKACKRVRFQDPQFVDDMMKRGMKEQMNVM